MATGGAPRSDRAARVVRRAASAVACGPRPRARLPPLVVSSRLPVEEGAEGASSGAEGRPRGEMRDEERSKGAEGVGAGGLRARDRAGRFLARWLARGSRRTARPLSRRAAMMMGSTTRSARRTQRGVREATRSESLVERAQWPGGRRGAEISEQREPPPGAGSAIRGELVENTPRCPEGGLGACYLRFG